MPYISPSHQVIAFDGVDALAFLQSQLTNDVAGLAVGAWQWQGYCNAKGRLHATFALVRTGESRFLAVVHSSVTPFVVKRLSMFRLRSKLTIAIDETLAVVFRFEAPPDTAPTLATLDLGHGRWVTIAQNSSLQLDNATPYELERWATIGIESIQPEIVAETNEKFVPQMLGWDRVSPGGGVSFSKGCYPGQEVVARAHYRGAVKRQPVVMSIVRDDPVAPGNEIEQSDGSAVEVVNVVRANNRWLALVVAPTATSAQT
jgi:tRNA-modifying protein YgfZ